MKIIETVFSILSPECRGLKIEKKGFDRIATHINLARIPVKSVHCPVWLMGPSTIHGCRKYRMLEQTILDGKDGINSYTMIQANELGSQVEVLKVQKIIMHYIHGPLEN